MSDGQPLNAAQPEVRSRTLRPRTIVAFNHRVKVRIVKRPTGTLDGMALKRYVPGEVYDLSPVLAEYLVMEGFARPEMRAGRRVVLKKKKDRRE